MNIYLIIQHEDSDWDTNSGLVIVAKNEEGVRSLAMASCGHEGPSVWEKAPIEKLGRYIGDKKDPFIVLVDNMGA